MPVAGSATISREWYRWAYDITQRVGGVTGSSTEDLTLSQFEDAGIEENKLAGFRLADEVGQIPPRPVHEVVAELEAQISSLRETVAVLARTIQDNQEGRTL